MVRGIARSGMGDAQRAVGWSGRYILACYPTTLGNQEVSMAFRKRLIRRAHERPYPQFSTMPKPTPMPEIEVTQLSSGYYHVRGRGPCNYSQPPYWPADKETLRQHAHPEASEAFLEAAGRIWRREEPPR